MGNHVLIINILIGNLIVEWFHYFIKLQILFLYNIEYKYYAFTIRQKIESKSFI